ncbi:MAG: UDP-glucose/GDP-mannose dehydrogenase family protein [Deltaproteobacteria bacterium]|nr:UDP-glucose/GDP-mannose dehydrogenase family protein [Deltaproteobacteria bacterium]
MKLCIIGTGYVGLVTGACFAEAGNDVICVDVDKRKIAGLNEGHIPIFEPGLEPMVQFNRREGRLTFATDLSLAVNESDICFIAVGTPPNEDGSADLTHVLDVAGQIATAAKKKVIVGTKSTVPVGTGDKIEAVFAEKSKHPFVVFSNPEFLKEGNAVNDFMKPDRVIVGLDHNHIEDLLRELYAPFTRQRDRLIFMSRRSAELTKYAANAMLATRISFMNEMANLCEKVGANINDVRQGIGSDPRIGSAFLFPGMGYGGSCFPKDVTALLNTAKGYDIPLGVVEACEEANKRQKKGLFRKIVHHFGGTEKIRGLKMAVWGLSFKARTDDIRESPALVLVDQLLEAGCRIAAFDPQAMPHGSKIYGSRIDLTDNNYDCLNDASALIVATDWNEFRSPDYPRMKKLMKQPVIFDGRNILNATHLKELGFAYYGIGI